MTAITASSVFNDEGTFSFLTLEMIQMLAVISAALEVTPAWLTKKKTDYFVHGILF